MVLYADFEQSEHVTFDGMPVLWPEIALEIRLIALLNVSVPVAD